MSAGKFTPGPWALHPAFARVVPAVHLDRPIGAAADKDEDFARYAQEICALHYPDCHRSASETRANGRLIAAAPELLQALQTFLALDPSFTADPIEFVQEMANEEGDSAEMARAVVKARAAIEKATGARASINEGVSDEG